MGDWVLRRSNDGGMVVLLTMWNNRLHLLVVLRHC
jgi:hypothetical protein